MSALALAVIRGPAAAAQVRYSVGGTVSLVRLQSGPAPVEIRGTAISGSARLSLWRIELETGYLEGKLRPNAGLTGSRDLVEGRLMLGVRPFPWLVMKVGPHARGYIRGGFTEQWIQWEARGRVEGSLATRHIRTHLELWRAMDGSVTNGAGAFGTGHGGEAGLGIRFPTAPVWACLTYTVERSGIASGLSLDTMERLGISVGIGAGW